MTTGLLAKDGVAPATATYDFNTATQFQDQVGPYWVSLLAWVDTADLAATGGLNFQMTHKDPSGIDIVSPTIQGNLILNDSTSRFETAPVMVQRFDGSARWDLDTTVIIGSAGSALVSYRMMVYPLDPSELSPFG